MQGYLFIHTGTCDGIVIEGGKIVTMKQVLHGHLQNSHEYTILGRTFHRPAKLDKKLAQKTQIRLEFERSI